MKKIKRYDEGGDVEMANATDDPIAALNKSRGWTDSEEASAVPAKQSFKESFASARKDGDKTFEWHGKKYTTEMAGSKSNTSSVPVTKTSTVKAAAAKYETPYDRMNRENRESEAAKTATDEETRRLRNRVPAPGRGLFKTSEQKFMGSGYKAGGSISSASSRADGCATKGKTKGRYL